MKEIWIIGAGRFGRLAADRLSEKIKSLHLVLVDPEKARLREVQAPGRDLIQNEGVMFLSKHLQLGEKDNPDWIVPAVPVHLAAEWLLRRTGPAKLERLAIPGNLDSHLPHPFRGENGNIYVSHADFLCPDDCAEPRDICTHTGKPRKRNMFELLADIHFPPWKTLVIRSHQLGPGIGGYRPKHLFELSEQVEGSTGPVMICTACRCHGVITGMTHMRN